MATSTRFPHLPSFYLLSSLFSLFPLAACMLNCLSRVWLFAAPRTVACQASLSMGFPRQEYWSRLPFSTPGALSSLGIKPSTPASPALAGGFFYHCVTWEAPKHTKPLLTFETSYPSLHWAILCAANTPCSFSILDLLRYVFLWHKSLPSLIPPLWFQSYSSNLNLVTTSGTFLDGPWPLSQG